MTRLRERLHNLSHYSVEIFQGFEWIRRGMPEAEAWAKVYRMLAQAINDISEEKADEEGWAKDRSETVDEKLVGLLALYLRCYDVRKAELERRLRGFDPLTFTFKLGPDSELSLDDVVKAIGRAKEKGDG
jgi:hypothetical protein